MRPTADEIFELLEAFEQQLRYLAEKRKHQGTDVNGNIIEGICSGSPTCIRCAMLRKADRIAWICARREIYVSDRIGISVFLDETDEVRTALKTVAAAPPEAIIEAVDGPREDVTLL